MKNLTNIFAAGILLTGSAVSAQTEIYSADFESAEGFTAGADLDGQNSWAVDQGSATVVTSVTPAPQAAQSGTQFVNQGSNSIIRYDFAGQTSQRVLVRGHYYGTGSATLTAPATNSDVAALIGFLNNNDGTFSVGAFNGDTDSFDVNQAQTFSASEWHEVALNIRYGTGDANQFSYDVMVNGVTTHLSIPFSQTVQNLNGFESHAETSSNTDNIQFLASDGNYDGDTFTDDEEFADAFLSPFDADPARSPETAIGNVALVTGLPRSFSMPGGVIHYHRVELPACSNVEIILDFDHADNDIQMDVYDYRCFDVSSGVQPQVQVAQSFRSIPSSQTPVPGAIPEQLVDQESTTYVNPLGNGEVYIRVFEQTLSDPNSSYTITVNELGNDDSLEFNLAGVNNSDILRPREISLNTAYEGLIAKDDDFYEVTLPQGVTSIDVEVEFNFLLGQIYFQVFDPAAPGGPFNGILAGIFTPNVPTLTATNVDVSNINGDTILVRTFLASPGGNFYDLTVTESGSSAKTVEFALPDSGVLPAASIPPSYYETAGAASLKGLNDDMFEENDIIEQLGAGAPLLPLNQPVNVTLLAGEEDWYKVPLAACENALVEVSFSGDTATTDIQLELYEARCFFDNGANINAFPFFRIASSYFGGLTESTTYANSTDNEFLYVRVFEQTLSEIPDYTIEVTTIGNDDAFEAGPFPSTPFDLAAQNLNTDLENLVLKNDDYFRIDTSNLSSLDITMNHDRTLGQIFIQVFEDNGGFTPFQGPGGEFYQNFTIADQLQLTGVDVSAASSVVVRVFAANRGANFYDLRIDAQ